VSFRVSDIFRTRTTHVHDFTFDNYVNRQTLNQLGRSFSLNLSYTFGYGKRVNKNIEIQSLPEITSGAAGS
ncbi:MAG: hypothetical protein K2I91_00145, partial [Muribaculaceae bacterium]|nr:hypothetical protein [Muribaculaceae bacterium]